MKVTITYSVEFTTTVEVPTGTPMGDVFSDIDIPENATSQYKPDSFEIIACLNEQGEEMIFDEDQDDGELLEVEIVAVNRKGNDSFQTTIKVRDLDHLSARVEAILDELPWHKVTLELIPKNFTPSPEQQKLLTSIEQGE